MGAQSGVGLTQLGFPFETNSVERSIAERGVSDGEVYERDGGYG